MTARVGLGNSCNYQRRAIPAGGNSIEMRFMSAINVSRKLRFSALILSFVFTSSFASAITPQVFAQTAAQQSSLRNFLIQYLGPPESEQARTNTRYLYATADLNGDGQPETIVYILSSGWCGSGGCPMLILTTQNAHYKVITRTTVTQLPIRLLPSQTNGWQDLAVSVSGGGIRPGYEAKLAFNGRKYPSNPTIAPATKLPSQMPGRTLIREGAEPQAIPVYR